ncbi:hypothetical protein JAAARDRAFT_128748 [Jaapia argillacea MUCL 33604]|uniref:methionyl-tRNA formyltransferase n=1 Tax=Jaapia argillacea MUCL 33604 TaxID=933084 RepID=A0A067Q7U2_9AGAM|nr:hypothetical protein JAAARDRAFT_128748 [Jaapia argillacea MUCL 33604]
MIRAALCHRNTANVARTSPGIRALRRTWCIPKGRLIHSIASPEPFKILFFGRDEFSCQVLRELYSARELWQSIAVVTQPDEKTGRRGSQLSISPLKVLGQTMDLPIHTIPHEKSAFKFWQPPDPFSKPEPPHLLLTASFGRILSNALLHNFLPSRRLNVHPSLLPLYRGAAPIQHALLDGRADTGVCVIEMMERKKGIDAGEIWGMKPLPIPRGSTFPTLRDTLAKEGGGLLVSTLRSILSGNAVSTTQTSALDAPRAPIITIEHSIVNFETMTAEDIIRRHGAISHQRPLITYLPTSKTLQLHEISSLPSSQSPRLALPLPGMATFHPPTRSLVIRCAGEALLSVQKVKQQDRSLLAAKEWWNGLRPEAMSLDYPGTVNFVQRCS